jgi:pimeloyl-ACP methyl ester carboxylesterase
MKPPLIKKSLALLAVVGTCAAIYLAVDPGRFKYDYVDAGGHRLRMLIKGRGSPTVVFETGGSPAAGGPLEAWERVQPSVSQFAKTVSYDRAGIGQSPPGPGPRDARQVARELHTALRNAKVAPPYVLVGHSMGGPFIRVFAGMYPGEVAGMVLVDPTQEEFLEWNKARQTNEVEREDEEWKEIMACLVEAHQSPVPAGIPVTVMTGMGPRVFPKYVPPEQQAKYRAERPTWSRFHQEWVDKIPGAKHVVTDNSGHGIPFEEPGLVVKTIRDVVEQGAKTPAQAGLQP